MLGPCRLAGLSALETYYADVRVCAQFGPTFLGGIPPISAWRGSGVVQGRLAPLVPGNEWCREHHHQLCQSSEPYRATWITRREKRRDASTPRPWGVTLGLPLRLILAGCWLAHQPIFYFLPGDGALCSARRG